MEKGTLYICGTPIGNLEDITIRQLKCFRLVDFIACEDTRHTLKLLNRYNIKAKLISFNEHNYNKRSEEVLELLKDGKNVALVSDAGMPLISDPGAGIVDLCMENGIKCTTVPGATALISGFILSGITSRVSSGGFVFGGFFPKENKERKEEIERLKSSAHPSIYYEAPHRIKKTLELLKKEVGGERKAAVVREITKVYEESVRGNFDELIAHFEQNEPRGEMVLVIEGVNEEVDSTQYDDLSIKEHVEMYLSAGIQLKDAMKRVAKDRGLSKRDVYAQIQIDKN